MTTMHPVDPRARGEVAFPCFDPRGAAAVPLSWALAVATVAATVPTLLVDGLLHGPSAMAGSARGTALVMLLVAVPLLVGSMLAARRGSVRGLLLWLGALAYLAYNAVMLLLGTPFNAAFLAYDATLGLAVWTAVVLLHRIDAAAVAARFTPGLRVRWVAVLVWVVAALNSLAWLRGIVAGMGRSDDPEFLRGTGLTTLPTYVQDLAFWLPLMAVAAWWLWSGRDWGYVLVPALLTYFVLESLGIAVDQAWGSLADPDSPVVSMAMAPTFRVVAAVTAVPWWYLLHHVSRTAP
jgi:hypothetical protein